jgi:hypothetical protein
MTTRVISEVCMGVLEGKIKQLAIKKKEAGIAEVCIKPRSSTKKRYPRKQSYLTQLTQFDCVNGESKSNPQINTSVPRFDMSVTLVVFPRIHAPVIRDAVYDQINHLHSGLNLIATHSESKAPLYICPEFLSKFECLDILDSTAGKWETHVESFDGEDFAMPNIQQIYLSQSDPVLTPLISRLETIAPNWSSKYWKIIRYLPGGFKLLHSDSHTEIVAPGGVVVDDHNRFQYMRQASLIIYLNTVPAGDGGVTSFYDADHRSVLRPVEGLGVLHACISATQESSSDKFCKLDPLAHSSFPITRASDDYRIRDSSWYHESSELLRGEKYIIVGFLTDKTMCDDDLDISDVPYYMGYDPRSIVPALRSQNWPTPPQPTMEQLLW